MGTGWGFEATGAFLAGFRRPLSMRGSSLSSRATARTKGAAAVARVGGNGATEDGEERAMAQINEELTPVTLERTARTEMQRRSRNLSPEFLGGRSFSVKLALPVARLSLN